MAPRGRSDGPLFAHPLMLGFAHLEEALTEAVGRGGSDGFPPYNIEQHSPQALSLTFALAGFAPDDIEVMQEGRQLRLSGTPQQNESASYIHRGIAARSFRRAFLLADGFDVSGCMLQDGLLTISLERPKEDAAPRRIKVTRA